MTDDRALPQWAQAAKPAAPALPQWAQAAKPEPKAAKPEPKGAVRQAVDQQVELTKNVGRKVADDYQDAYGQSRDIAHAGIEQFKQPGVLNKVGGAADVLRGGIGMNAAPLTAVWNALGMTDPMLTGGETVHTAGAGIKAAEGAPKPIAAPAIKSGEQVFTGPNHQAMRDATGLKDPETGFVKQDGAFVGRKEAAAEAMQAGEAAPAKTGKGLHSEDLPPEQKPSLVAPVGKDNAAPLPKWAQDTGATATKPAPQPVSPVAPPAAKPAEAKPFTPPVAANPLPPNVTPLKPKNKPQGVYEKWFDTLQKEGTHTQLPMDPEARVERAKAQGFNTDLTLYHGTGQNYMQFKVPGGSEPAVFLADNPKVSQAYASKGAAPQIIPIWAKMVNPKTVDLKGAGYNGHTMSKILQQAKAAGHDSVIIKNITDIGGGLQNQYAFFKPENLRAKYGAAFDPKVKPAQAHMLSAGSNVIPKAPADDARLLLRQRIGLGTRDTKQSVTRIQPFEKALNTLDEQGVRDFWAYVENRSKKGGADLRPRDPAVAAAADEWRAAAKQREAKMSNFDDAEKMSFVEDYGPHMYEGSKPKAEGGIGTGASTFFHKRSIPTFAEAEEFGFKPKYPPAEMMGRYLAMMDKHIALKEVRETAKETKDIKRAMPGKQPDGWVELKGTRDQMGNSLYAPPEWAQAYNRTVDYVPHGGLWGSVRSVANASQSLSFFLNARHALTVGVEAMGAEVARAATHAGAGQFKTAAGAALKSAYAMGHYGLKGNKGLHLYDHDVTNFGEMGEIVSLLTQVNAHSGGKLNYMSATKHGGLYKSYKAGSIPAEFKSYRANIAARKTMLGKGAETAKTALTLIGRVMDDIQEPLFGYAIPRVKYGVSMEALGDWLQLNPMATHAEKLAMAAKISDHVDNVFGELMMDNRFLDAKVREALEVALISVGWNYGFYSELAHGAKSAGKSFGQALNIKSPHYDPRAVGLVGMVAGSAIYNAIYQAVKTGTAPSEPMDLIAAQSGGKNPDGTPERLAPITNTKEAVDIKHVLDAAARGESGKGAIDYARAKIKPVFTLAADLLTNSDWKNDPILKPSHMVAGEGGEHAWNVAKEWTSNLFDFAWGGAKPFVLNDRRAPNSGISDMERWLGLQPAGKKLANPKGQEDTMRAVDQRRWRTKERRDAKQKALYKGTSGQ